MSVFKLHSDYKPAGDQPKAIEALVKGIKAGDRHQTLLGFPVPARLLRWRMSLPQIGKPTLVIAHNKTLAAQLAQEYAEFFPGERRALFRFVFGLPSARSLYAGNRHVYREGSDDKRRNRPTAPRFDASAAYAQRCHHCRVGLMHLRLGSPAEYEKENMKLEVGAKISRTDFIHRLVDIHFERTNADLSPGNFRAIANKIEIMPTSEETIYRVSIEGDVIASIEKIDPTTRRLIQQEKVFFIFPAKHFITADDDVKRARRSR